MNRPLRLVVADDHALFREGLVALLEASGLEVTGQARDGEEAITALRTHRPDIVLLDVQMPGPGIRDLVTAARAQAPSTLIAILTMHADPDLADDLEALGARGYFVKNVGHRALVAGLHAMTDSHEPIRLLPRAVNSRQASSLGLTPREVEVVRLLARSYSNRRIAESLYLSEATVKRHLTTIYRKLGASGRLEALTRAQESGLIERPT